MEITSYLILGLLIVLSPGADFVLVFKNSLGGGRKAGLLTGLGIGIGVCIHISYSILGISHLFSQSAFLFNLVKYAGSAYLIYLGITGIFSSRLKFDGENVEKTNRSARKYFAQGFFCNMLNPKTMLFFLSVFSQLVAPGNETNFYFVLSYGLYIALLHIVWFCLLALIITSSQISGIFERFGRRINQVCGAGLVTFGVMLSANS
ncbi:LysE family translocator [Vibrio sp. JC009]|uniref:LysE family translocator n=1 Tax=Vibrio sp. JC009 TaxID=2912314 RepID=UPI0023B0E1BA|nr:LysE family translocator [Vibrio sp. JC009]WED23780.1 LysE family translocator [Vibrio sp. JC009]